MIADLVLGSPERPLHLDAAGAAHLTAATESALGNDAITGLRFLHAGDTLAVAADPPPDAAARLEARLAWHRLMRSWETASKPIALVLTGKALDGAADLALAFPRLFVGHDARVGWPGLLRGRWDALGASQRLPRRLGLQAGLTAMLTPGGHDADALVAAGLAQASSDPMAAAEAWLSSRPEVADPFAAKGFRWPRPAPVTPQAQGLLLAAQAQVANAFPRGHVAEQLLVAASEGAPIVFDRALEVEARVWNAWSAP